MNDTALHSTLATALFDGRERCARQGLMGSQHAGLSLRLPGETSFLFIDAKANSPQRLSWHAPLADLSMPLSTVFVPSLKVVVALSSL